MADGRYANGLESGCRMTLTVPAVDLKPQTVTYTARCPCCGTPVVWTSVREAAVTTAWPALCTTGAGRTTVLL